MTIAGTTVKATIEFDGQVDNVDTLKEIADEIMENVEGVVSVDLVSDHHDVQLPQEQDA